MVLVLQQYLDYLWWTMRISLEWCHLTEWFSSVVAMAIAPENFFVTIHSSFRTVSSVKQDIKLENNIFCLCFTLGWIVSEWELKTQSLKYISSIHLASFVRPLTTHEQLEQGPLFEWIWYYTEHDFVFVFGHQHNIWQTVGGRSKMLQGRAVETDACCITALNGLYNISKPGPVDIAPFLSGPELSFVVVHESHTRLAGRFLLADLRTIYI